MKIEDIMSKDIISCDINSSISDIAKTMLVHDIGFLPITDKGNIIGVLTDRDIVIKIMANNDNKIKGYLSDILVTIDINKDIDDALKLMRENKIKRLLVTKKDNIVGIISLSDIINKTNAYDTIKTIFNITNNNREKNVSVNKFEL